MRRIFAVLGVVFAMQICLSEEVRLAPIALGGSSSAVQSPATVKVRGKGVGVTKAEALKDAYRDAVERAVGLFVDAEQFVKNDELIKDQILTQSNAYIKQCQEVGEENEGGLVRVTILAEVVKSAVTKRISDVMPPQTYNLGSDGLNVHAQMVSTMKRNQDATALMKNVLDDFNPVKQLMKVGLAKTQPEVAQVKGNSDRASLSYLLKVEVDQKKYREEVVPRPEQDDLGRGQEGHPRPHQEDRRQVSLTLAHGSKNGLVGRIGPMSPFGL